MERDRIFPLCFFIYLNALKVDLKIPKGIHYLLYREFLKYLINNYRYRNRYREKIVTLSLICYIFFFTKNSLSGSKVELKIPRVLYIFTLYKGNFSNISRQITNIEIYLEKKMLPLSLISMRCQ